jgi:TPR repeat protein
MQVVSAGRRTVFHAIRCQVVVAGLVMACRAPQAEPADDHQRGLQAYQRGDVIAAMTALKVGAQAGHAASQNLLAFILDRADFPDEAAPLWQAAANQGDAEAHAGLANLYLTGRGIAKDEKRALQHFSEAAARGHGPSVEVVATAWLKGKLGADAAADPSTANAALLRAAERGHLPSADALAVAYRQGGYGLSPDAAKASEWQSRAATWRQQRTAVASATAASRPKR